MSFELLFDGVESRAHIQDQIGKLQRLGEVDPGLKRPPRVKIIWGAEGTRGMMPLRASVALRFREARTLAVARVGRARRSARG